MLGVTNFISTDIAAVPLLWVIPLSLYLLTFVLAFARRPPIRLSTLIILLPIGTIAVIIGNFLEALSGAALIGLNLVYFFIAALTCHTQLAQDRPSTSRLTEFYFWLSFGGVLGGIFNALVAPILFESVVEYPLVILLACLLSLSNGQIQTRRARILDFLVPAGALVFTLSMVLIFYSFGHASNARPLLALVTAAAFFIRKRPVRFALFVSAILLGAGVVTTISDNAIHRDRNFFGVLRVTNDPQEQIHWLFHGSTNHGRQFTKPERKCEALSYYHQTGPLGEVFANFRSSSAAKKVAIVGLGTGATAVYAEPNEQWTFYEINPAVVDIARNPEYFTYLTQCSSVPVDVVLGDARLRIREASDASYGLIVLDAFSSDAIPLHLITQEALDLYLSKLAPEGMLVFHISNRHMDLSPVMADLASSRALYCLGLYDPAAYNIQGKDTSVWVVMAHQPADTGKLADSSFARVLKSDGRHKVWTDDFSNIVSVLTWR
jgi:spermidine synthase